MAIRWKKLPAKAAVPRGLKQLVEGIKERAPATDEEHDDQVALFRDHIKPRLVAGAVAFAIPNGGYRSRKSAGRIKAEGAAAGVPDIFAIWHGQCFFLEMKRRRGGRVSKEQVAMMAALDDAGAIVAVAKGLDAAIKQLEEWGLLAGDAQIGRVAA